MLFGEHPVGLFADRTRRKLVWQPGPGLGS